MNSRPVYKDFWFRIAGSFVASQVIDSINREESYFKRFTNKYFYTDLLGGFVIALLLWEIVRQATLYLDKRYSWLEKPAQRALLQFTFGVFAPVLLSFFFTWIFMKLAYDQDIFQTNWLNSELYAIVLIIILVNVIYFTLWLYLTWQEQDRQKASTVAGGNISSPAEPKAEPQKTNNVQPVLEVAKAGKTVLLRQNEIACAYLSNSYCYIKTFGDDVFVTGYTLDEIGQQLDKDHFFRANRQTLINRRSCSAYKSVENGKIELDLHPSLKHPVVVSQKKASEFRKWISSAIVSE